MKTIERIIIMKTIEKIISQIVLRRVLKSLYKKKKAYSTFHFNINYKRDFVLLYCYIV